MASKSQRAITDAKPGDWARLGRALQAWREDILRYEHRAEFARKTGINIRLVQDLEKNYRDTYTKWKLDEAARAYEIEHPDPRKIAPSLLAVLHGEADTFVRAAGGPHELTSVPGRLPAAPPSNLLREEDARPYVGPIFERLGYLHAARRIAEPTGEEMVREPDGTRITRIDGTPLMTAEDISVFDGARGAMSDEDRVWLVGDIHARREARAAQAHHAENSA